MAAYRLSERAFEDLVAIDLHGIETFGERQALRYSRSMSAALESLVANPQMARLRPDLGSAIRLHPRLAHLIIYTVRDDGSLLVLRVLHGSEDVAAHPLD